MASEWRVAVSASGLERGKRAQILETLASRANEETGLVAVSHTALAYDVRASERQVIRVLKDLVAEGGLVTPVRKGNGRGACSVYKIDVRTLQLVAQAVQTARSVIQAGALKALHDAGLVGARVTSEAVLSVFDVLAGAARAEGGKAEAASIEALGAVYRSRAGCEQGCAGADGKGDSVSSFPAGDGADLFTPGKGDTKGDMVSPLETGKGDMVSGKGDISSNPPTPPYKEIHHLHQNTRECARAGKRVALADLVAGPMPASPFSALALHETEVLVTGAVMRVENPHLSARKRLQDEKRALKRLAGELGCSGVEIAAPAHDAATGGAAA